MIPLWNPVHNLHSLELLWDHVCRCQEIPYAPLTHGLPLANSSSVIDPPPTSPLPSDTPAISCIEDSSQRTCGASDSSPPPSLARTVHSSRIYRSLCPLCAYLRDSLPDCLPFVLGRETKETGGEASMPAVCCVGFSLRVTCPISVLVFPSLPPSSFFLSDSSLRCFRPLCSPRPHHPLRDNRAASRCACLQDRFRLPTLAVTARPTSRYPPIDTPSLFSGHPPRSHGLISTGAGIFTDDIPPFIPARSMAGAVPSQHGR